MCHLVDERGGNVLVPALEEGVENGIGKPLWEPRLVEPAKGGVGGDVADGDIPVFGFKLLGEFECVCFLEVATILLTTDEPVAPALAGERERFGGGDGHRDVAASKVGVARVA